MSTLQDTQRQRAAAESRRRRSSEQSNDAHLVFQVDRRLLQRKVGRRGGRPAGREHRPRLAQHLPQRLRPVRHDRRDQRPLDLVCKLIPFSQNGRCTGVGRGVVLSAASEHAADGCGVDRILLPLLTSALPTSAGRRGPPLRNRAHRHEIGDAAAHGGAGPTEIGRAHQSPSRDDTRGTENAQGSVPRGIAAGGLFEVHWAHMPSGTCRARPVRRRASRSFTLHASGGRSALI